MVKSVQIILLEEQIGKVKAIANVNIDDYIVRDLKVVEGINGIFVGMPSKKIGDNYRDCFFPATKAAREDLMDKVLKAYKSKVEDESTAVPPVIEVKNDTTDEEFPF
jgi:stage V sporulation protein G